MVHKQPSSFLRVIQVLALLHAALFGTFWLTNRLFYADVNKYLFENLGRRWDYIFITLLISAGMGLWSSLRLLLVKPQGNRPGWGGLIFLAAAAFYLLFFYGSFWMLFHQSPTQWTRLWRLLDVYRFIPDVLFLVSTVFVFSRLEKTLAARFSGDDRRKKTLHFTYLGIFVLIWSVPLMFPPASVRRSALPPKPLVIAHRGASMLAPENTLAAARKANALGAVGLEADIRISLDGIPFLMHDYGLERTTNVTQVFPNRKEDLPESFTLAELKQLNAGEWFILEDPYHTIADGLVNPDEAQALRSEKIPTLAEVLDFLQGNEMVFIFDLLSPPEDHPFHEPFFDICFSQIHQAGVDSRVWFLAKGEERLKVISSAPQMVLTYGADYKDPPDAQALSDQGYQIVNVDYGMPLEWIARYKQAGLKVNPYVVDEPAMFSRLWLAGADSMTTNNVHSMVSLNKPTPDLPYMNYLLVYCLVGFASLGLSFIIKHSF
jgi:glycerophosphoinositol inositolphosphodiesterase